MALDFLSKLRKGKGAGAGGGGDSSDSGGPGGHNGFVRDPEKAAKFYRHAQATAESRQYDYSIECYINGLHFEPDNVSRHEELREVAKRRKVAGLKPAGFKEKNFAGGSKNPIDKMLHAEKIWSKNTLNADDAMRVMELAVDANQQVEGADLEEFAYWIGSEAMKLVQTSKKGDKARNAYLKMADLFAAVPAFDKAMEACRYAVALDPDNRDLLQRLKDLETEKAIGEGKYGSGKEGGFVEALRDGDAQFATDQEHRITKTESIIEGNIARFRQAHQEDPEDLDVLGKLVNALLQKKEEPSETEAIGALEQAWQSSNQYKFKMQIGDIRMRQLRREQRGAEAAAKQSPNDESARQKVQQLKDNRNQFELAEFTDRAKNYPTDMRIRYELGVRYFATKQYDEAIAEFQKAQADPKHRAAALGYLGQCYIISDWLDEAIDALRMGIEAHPLPDDKLGMELRYLLMNALEHSAEQSRSLETAQEAQKTASQILQTDIGYRDIRERMTKLKKLVAELQGN